MAGGEWADACAPGGGAQLDVCAALERKVSLSVGLANRVAGELAFRGDLARANSKAATRREIAAFEQRFALDDSDEEDSADEHSGGDKVQRGLATADLSWSDEAPELDRLARSKRNAHLGQLRNVLPRLSTLRLKACGIECIGAGARELCNLRELNVSANRLRVVDNLPRGLISLQAYDNQIGAVRVGADSESPSLYHLGLGYNRLQWLDWLPGMPSLRSLDLCFNDLCDLDHTIEQLEGLEELSELFLFGNPIALLPDYRHRVLERLPWLEALDGIPTTNQATGSAGGSPHGSNASGHQTDAARSEGVASPDAGLLGDVGHGNTPAATLSLAIEIASASVARRAPKPEPEEQQGGEQEQNEDDASAKDEPADTDSAGPPEPRRRERLGFAVEAHLPDGSFVRTDVVFLPDVGAGEDDPEASEAGVAPPPFEIALGAQESLECMPTPELRDAMELEGVLLRLIAVRQTLEDPVAGDGLEGTDDQAGGAPSEPVEPIVISEEEQELAEGRLDTNGVLHPESHSKLVLTDAQVALQPAGTRELQRGNEAAKQLLARPADPVVDAEGCTLVVSLRVNAAAAAADADAAVSQGDLE